MATIENSDDHDLRGDIALVSDASNDLSSEISGLFREWKKTDGLHVANTLQLEVILDTYERHCRFEHDTRTSYTAWGYV